MIKPVELEEFEKIFTKNWRRETYQGGPQNRLFLLRTDVSGEEAAE